MKQGGIMKTKTVKDALGLGSTDVVRKERSEQFINAMAALINPRIDKAERLKKRGANMYRVLLARLTDDKTNKLLENPVIYAIRTIKEQKAARSFFFGYAKDIRRDPKRHPWKAATNPKEYARAAIMLALNAHFTNPKTHKLWTRAVKGEKTRYSYALGCIMAY